MANFTLGLRVLFRIWSDAEFARQVVQLERGKLAPKAEPKPPAEFPSIATKPPPKEPRRSEAVTLLAVLQREARFVDFIKEPIASYSDAQIGAAVRDVHKSCAAVLDRAFALQPMSAAAEGASIEVPRPFEPAQFRLTGNVTGEPPYRGAVRHHGWKATQCELPAWNGSDAAALVVAPVEVEVK